MRGQLAVGLQWRSAAFRGAGVGGRGEVRVVKKRDFAGEGAGFQQRGRDHLPARPQVVPQLHENLQTPEKGQL